MAHETPFVYAGFGVSFDPLVHRGKLNIHPDDWAKLRDNVYPGEDVPICDTLPDHHVIATETQDDRDQQDAAAFAQDPDPPTEEHHEG